MLMYLYLRCVCVCNLFITNANYETSPHELFQNASTGLSKRHWLLPKCVPSLMCVIFCTPAIIILLTMIEPCFTQRKFAFAYTHQQKLQNKE